MLERAEEYRLVSDSRCDHQLSTVSGHSKKTNFHSTPEVASGPRQGRQFTVRYRALLGHNDPS